TTGAGRPPVRAHHAVGSAGVDVAQRANQTTRALVGAMFRRAVAGLRVTTRKARLVPRLQRLRTLAVQRLGDGCGAAGVRQPHHLAREHLLAARDTQRVADAHRARSLGPLPAEFDLAVLDRLPRQRARPEEARSPKPHVDTDRSGGAVTGG